MKSTLFALVLLTSAMAKADLFADQAAQQQAQQEQAVRERMALENARLVQGLRRQTEKLAPIDPSSAKCSDGWEDGDYQNAVDQACDSQGCFTLYTRDPRDYKGILFTCHFNLTDGSECFAQAYMLPHDGFSGRCVDTQLKNHPIDVNVDVGGSGKPKGKAKPKPKKKK